MVLATVTHLDQGVLEVEFAGLAKALEPTASHPLFSADRNDWVPAGQLRVGEQIRTRTGSARIEVIRWKQGEERVYNIEVEADHAYFVSELELLSHNNNPCGAAANTTTSNATKKKSVVIGENMQDRVKPAAREMGADYYKPRGGYTLDKNKRWIKDKMREGREVIDIGRDPNRNKPSEAYRMEREELRKKNYSVREAQ